MPQRIDPRLAAELDASLWSWVRKRTARDKDMSAALDILKHYANHKSMYPIHQEAVQALLKGDVAPELPPIDALDPSNPTSPMASPASPKRSPEAILRQLSQGGMLRGRNGSKAMSLLQQADHWTSSQASYAESLAKQIQLSALVYTSLRDIAEQGRGGRFVESLVESFDDWGSYTDNQLQKAIKIVIDETGEDPRELVDAPTNIPTHLPNAQAPGPASDDDIPF